MQVVGHVRVEGGDRIRARRTDRRGKGRDDGRFVGRWREERVDKGALESAEFGDVAILAADYLPQDLLPRPFPRTQVLDQIILCDLAPTLPDGAEPGMIQSTRLYSRSRPRPDSSLGLRV